MGSALMCTLLPSVSITRVSGLSKHVSYAWTFLALWVWGKQSGHALGYSILCRTETSRLYLALSYSILQSNNFDISYSILKIIAKIEWLYILFQ
jgi:hypothetical protein